MLVSKYLDHTPPYRQARIYARAGLDIDRETMVVWGGKAAWLLRPLTERIARHVFTTGKIHTENTPLSGLAPDSGRTRRGRVWIYLRDNGPAAMRRHRQWRYSTAPTARERARPRI